MKILALVVVLLSAAAVGCTSTSVSSIETGLFENDPDKLVDAHDRLEQERLRGNVITRKDVMTMGFNLTAPNVAELQGPDALKRIYGDQVFRVAGDVEKMDTNLQQFARYRCYSIPYQWLETTADRMYISEVEVIRKGVQVQVRLLFNGDTLCYAGLQTATINTYYSHYALFEGIISLVKSPGKAALEITERVHNYTRPGLEYEAPIPIKLP